MAMAARGLVVLFAVAIGQASASDARMTVVNKIYPMSGLKLGSTLVTVMGENLEMIRTCKFGDTQTPVIHAEQNGLEVTCKSPEVSMPIPMPVSVSLSSGANADFMPLSPKNTTIYTYYDVPRITRVEPTAGPATGGKDVTLTVDRTFLAGNPKESTCMFGKKVTPVKSHRCLADVCYITCTTPQACVEVDLETNPKDCNADSMKNGYCCKTHTVLVQLSLNGQDFTTDPKETIEYTYENAWTHPAL